MALNDAVKAQQQRPCWGLHVASALGHIYQERRATPLVTVLISAAGQVLANATLP